MDDRLTTARKAHVAEGAHALSLFRVLPNGEGRNYTATTFPADPYSGCERFVRLCKRVGWIRDSHLDAYGVLDVLNADGDIVQDFSIVDARAFQAIKKKLNIVVDEEPGG